MANKKHTFSVKDNGKHIVFYAEETKSKEFDTEEEANEFSEQVEEEY